PADVAASAEGQGCGPSGPAADEGHESRSIGNGCNGSRHGHPVPAGLVGHPATIVIGGPAPGFGCNPCPSPRILPDPMSLDVGLPPRVDDRGCPHGAVAGEGDPWAVLAG